MTGPFDPSSYFSLNRRSLLAGAASAAMIPAVLRASARSVRAQSAEYDIIVVGAGNAGMPAAIFAAQNGARVALVDAADKIGGTLHLAGGEICGAQTKTQARFGVTDDHPDIHYDDVMRLTNGKADPDIVRLTVDNAGAIIDWLDDHGWDCRPGHFITGEFLGRAGYSVKRYYQADGGGLAMLKVFAEQVEKTATEYPLTIVLNNRVQELLTRDDGTVEGIRAIDNLGFINELRAKHVIVTTGGYVMDPPYFESLIGQPAYRNDSYFYSRGDGLKMAEAIGAALRGHDLHRPGSGSVLTAHEFPAELYVRVETRPQARLPWEIWVNNRGERYVNEQHPNGSVREQALLKQPRLAYGIVFDEEIFTTADPCIAEWDRDKIASHFNTHIGFYKGDTLEELASRCGFDVAGLQKTVADYNAGIGGTSDPFGREHRPLPIAEPPYYLILHHGHSATSSVGITVNKDLQAVTPQGNPIPGLYAAGEVLGSGVSLGNAFAPGMMITPAMTLGRLLGERLAVT